MDEVIGPWGMHDAIQRRQKTLVREAIYFRIRNQALFPDSKLNCGMCVEKTVTRYPYKLQATL